MKRKALYQFLMIYTYFTPTETLIHFLYYASNNNLLKKIWINFSNLATL